VILQTRRDDLGRTGREPVDDDRDRHPPEQLAVRGMTRIDGVRGPGSATPCRDDQPAVEEPVADLDGRGQQSARIPAEVDHQPAQAGQRRDRREGRVEFRRGPFAETGDSHEGDSLLSLDSPVPRPVGQPPVAEHALGAHDLAHDVHLPRSHEEVHAIHPAVRWRAARRIRRHHAGRYRARRQDAEEHVRAHVAPQQRHRIPHRHPAHALPVDRHDPVACQHARPPGRPAHDRRMHHDAAVVRDQFETDAAELLVERRLQVAARRSIDERRVLVEPGDDRLERRGLELGGGGRLEGCPLDHRQHLPDVPPALIVVAGQPRHERDGRDQRQEQEVALGHGGGGRFR